jgi:hypothetical protein
MAVAESAPDLAQRHRPKPPIREPRPVVAPEPPRTGVLPPSNGAPSLARAGAMIAAATPDVVARAKMSVGLQQNVGNARMGAMAAEKAPPPKGEEKAEAKAAEPEKKEKAEAKAAEPEKKEKAEAKAAEPEKKEKKEAAPAPKAAAEKEEKAAARPSARAAIGPAVAAVNQRAAKTRKHAPPAKLAASAQAAAIEPKTEQMRGAAVQTVATLDAAEAEKVRRETFKAKLKEAIDKATPKPTTEDEAEAVMENGAAEANQTLRGAMTSERDTAAGPLKAATGSEAPASDQPAPPKTELESEPVGSPPAPVSAGPVVPEPLPPEQFDYSSDRASTDQAMADAGVSTEQLAKGNEPSFQSTLAERSTAEEHEAQAQATYRQSEGKIQGQALKGAQGALATELGGMHELRGLHVGAVAGQQTDTQTKNAQERERVTKTITGIKDTARADVEVILTSMETEAADIFEAGLKRAEKVYEDTFEEEKGGVGTWLTTWGDDWKELIESSLGKAREAYLREVDAAIDEVATLVDAKLAAAKKRVADGRKEVEEFVKTLDESVRGFGEDVLQKVSADFDAMGSEIDQRRDNLVDKLAQQYKESYERMSAKEEELRNANKSLWERIYDATIGLIEKIIEFKNMLMNVLAKAVSVVLDIISDPIGFLGNLINGVMTGLNNFMANIGTHLMKGLMDWLFGALGGAGLQLPDAFDLKGIVSIVLQVLGLTYENFRARAVGIVGEDVVSAIEKTAEVFKIIATKGISGLWEFIKEKVGELKSMVLDAIFEYVKEKILVAGVTWLLSLLNPASAFFKACKAIYDIIKFFIERASQIAALINAIIDSIAAIAKGAIDAAAKAVEDALAKAIPVAIGFLAALLGLGDISATIRKVIDKAQAPINKAIDWVIHQAVKLVKSVWGLFGKKKGGEKEKSETKDADPKHDAEVAAAVAQIQKRASEKSRDGTFNKADATETAAVAKSEAKVFTFAEVIEEKDGWYLVYEASPRDKKKIAEHVEELEKIATRIHQRNALLQLENGHFVRTDLAKKLAGQVILKGQPEGQPVLEGKSSTAVAKRREVAPAVHREIAGALILSQLPGVTTVAMGAEAKQEIYPGEQPGQNVDIVATTEAGTRLLGEAKGLADPAKAVSQLEIATKKLDQRSIDVDGYYIFVEAARFTQPGFSVENGILHFEGAPRLIDKKPVYVVVTTPSAEQIKATIGT